MKFGNIFYALLLFSVLTSFVFISQDDVEAVDVSSLDEFRSALTSEQEQTIVIKSDITLSELITVNGVKTITSDGGCSIIRGEGYNRGSLLDVSSGSHLRIAGDITIDGNKDWITDNQSDALVKNHGTLTIDGDVSLKNNIFNVQWMVGTPKGGSAISNYGILELKSGSIEENRGGTGAVYSAGGSVTMESFSIVNNGSLAVCIADTAKFDMKSGEISGNNSGVSVSGDVFRGRSVFNLSGGSICDNGGTVTSGAGVNLGAYSTFNMTGGDISGNIATEPSWSMYRSSGGGLYVSEGSTATLSGGVISDNTASEGAGVYCKGALKLAGTSISNNNHDALLIHGPTVEMTGGTIDNNDVLIKVGTFRFIGGSITNTPGSVSCTGSTEYGVIFEFGGDAHFDSKSVVNMSVTLIEVNSKVIPDHALTLDPESYIEGLQVLKGSPPGLVAINHSKVDVVPFKGERWEVDSEGCLVNTHIIVQDGMSEDLDSSEDMDLSLIIGVIVLAILIIIIALRMRSNR